jgi:hypothetical protein
MFLIPVTKLAAESAAIFIATAFLVKPPLVDSVAVEISVFDVLTLSAASEAPVVTFVKHSAALLLTSWNTLDASSNAVILNSTLALTSLHPNF